jgi:hypothetical protein
MLGLCFISLVNAAPALAAGDPNFDPVTYQSQLATLSPKALDGEYAKKLGAWGVACIPDGLKVGVSGVLETVPIVSLFNDFVGNTIHDLGRENSSYKDTFISSDDGIGHLITSALLGGPLGYLAIQAYDRAYNALYGGDSGQIRTGAYATTRVLAHDSFDANSNSLCRQSAMAISEIRIEKKRRRENVSQPNTQQSSVAQKPLFNRDTTPVQSPTTVVAGQAS